MPHVPSLSTRDGSWQLSRLPWLAGASGFMYGVNSACSPEEDDDLTVAIKLMKGCYELYRQAPSGVAYDSVLFGQRAAKSGQLQQQQQQQQLGLGAWQQQGAQYVAQQGQTLEGSIVQKAADVLGFQQQQQGAQGQQSWQQQSVQMQEAANGLRTRARATAQRLQRSALAQNNRQHPVQQQGVQQQGWQQQQGVQQQGVQQQGVQHQQQGGSAKSMEEQLQEIREGAAQAARGSGHFTAGHAYSGGRNRVRGGRLLLQQQQQQAGGEAAGNVYASSNSGAAGIAGSAPPPPSPPPDHAQEFFFQPRSRENFLRPEVAEALFYLWRATGAEVPGASAGSGCGIGGLGLGCGSFDVMPQDRIGWRFSLLRAALTTAHCSQVRISTRAPVVPQVTGSTASGAGTCSARTSAGAACPRAATRRARARRPTRSPRLASSWCSQPFSPGHRAAGYACRALLADASAVSLAAAQVLSNVETVPPMAGNKMESFWLAETLKYFYLLFSDDPNEVRTMSSWSARSRRMLSSCGR
jgi:hypothetical protein